MNAEHKYRGYLETFKNGWIRGWAETNIRTDQPNDCELWVDNHFVSEIHANDYREDLKDAGVRDGCAGFLTPLPLFFCDGQTHELELRDKNHRLQQKTFKLTPPKHLIPLDENIVFDRVNTPFKPQQKLLLLAGLSHQKTLLNYQQHLIHSFQQKGYYVILLLASDEPMQLTSALTASDRVIIRHNIGYDFGSWATGWQYCQPECLAAQEVIFINDSMIGPIGSLDVLISKIEQSPSEIWAITDSYDRQYHFQSYCWGIKKPPNTYAPVIDAFFFYRQELPTDKESAIHNFEVKALDFFKQQGLSVDILFPEVGLIDLAESRFIESLQAHSEKWQALFNLPLPAKRFDSLQIGIGDISYVFFNRLTTNSSHLYWNALLEQGFPFIKRELLLLNPINYPFPQQFRAVFRQHQVEHLLVDLPGAVKIERMA